MPLARQGLCFPSAGHSKFSPTKAHLEMINLVIALRMCGAFWANLVVTAHCDNSAVVQVVDYGRPRDLFLAVCFRNIWLIAAKWDIDFKVVHIPGKKNSEADTLSSLHSFCPIDQDILHKLQQNNKKTFSFDRAQG